MHESSTESSSISISTSKANRLLLINRLTEQATEVDGFITGLTEEQLKERPEPDGWSLHELVVHLAMRQDLFVDRVARMLVEEMPELHSLDEDTIIQRDRLLEELVQHRFRGYQEQRKNLLGLLSSLDEQRWRAEAIHPTVKHYSVEKCVESFMRFEASVLREMFQIFFGVRE